MKGKKKLKILLLSMVLIVATMTLLVLNISAVDQTPVLSIDYCNLSFSDSVYIKYAVASNVENAKLLIWTAPRTEYVKGTESEILSSVNTEEISGKEYAIFDYTSLAAKQMTDVVYARVWVQDDGVDYYSVPHKYSVLQYVYNKNGKLGETSNENLKKLLESMLSYGADAQTYFDYETDRLATADFYQVKLTSGELADGFSHGLYPAGETVQLKASATDGMGGSFSYWKDSVGAKVSEEASFELIVGGKNEEYTPVYVKTSQGLEIDEEGYVLSMGDCTDTDVVIPAKTENGVSVIGIDGSAFAGEPITSISFPSTLEEIGRRAFNGCTALTDVYYDGTEEEWSEKVSVSSGNDALLDATFHFVTPPAKTFTVTFKDYDGTVLKTETVAEGKNASAPVSPSREGYTFTGWNKEFSNISADLIVTALYEKVEAGYTKTTLAVESVSAKAGDTVQLAVSVYENPGILGMTLSLNFDDSKMTLTEVANGSAVSSLTFTKPSRFIDGCDFVWYGENLTAEQIKDGEVLLLTFKLADGCADGNYPVSISYVDGDVFDKDLQYLTLDIVNGNVSVQ